MFILCVYVPETHVNEVKEAIFAYGGGKLGDYEGCAWQTKGVGQFTPLEGSDPYLGQRGRLQTVIEVKLEVIVAESKINAVIEAIKRSHPYEEPAYHYMQVNC